MPVDELFREALRAIRTHALRSFLTLLGIVIGVLAVVSIVALGQGLQQQVGAQIGRLGTNSITVMPGFDRARGGFGGFGGGEGGGAAGTQVTNLTQKDVDVIRGTPGIQDVDAVISGRATVQYRTGKASLSVQGVDTAVWKDMTTATLSAGRFLQPGDSAVAVVGSSVANGVFGDPVGLNQILLVGGHQVRVVGILEAAGGFGGGDSVLYMPRDDAATLLGKPLDEFSSITANVVAGEDVVAVGNATSERLLASRHETPTTQDFTVQVPQAAANQAQTALATLAIFIEAIAGISLLVGAVMIVNTMFMAVMERSKQIGILKALGTSANEVRLLFLTESSLIGMVGGVLGAVSSFLLAAFLDNVGLPGIGFGRRPGGGGGGAASTLSITIPLDLALYAVIGATIIGAIAGVLPANRAARLQPVETLRAE